LSDNNWTKEQLAAISAQGCNLLVAAGAGAGKTAVLVERIIRKITAPENPVDLDKLLVMTFTNAAAAEMRERIAQAIAERLEANPANHNIRRQLTLLNKANITTIHSFCLDVIRNNFQSIDLDPGFRISDQTEAELLKIEVLKDLFEELYEQETLDPEFYRLLECYAGNRDDKYLQDMVLNLYNFGQSNPNPEAWLKKMTEKFLVPENIDFSRTPWGEVLLEALELELQDMEHKLREAVGLLQASTGLDRYLPVFQEEYNFMQSLAQQFTPNLPQWDKLYRLINSFQFSRLPSAGKDADKSVQEQVKDMRDEVKKSFQKIKDQIFVSSSAEIIKDLRSLYPLMNCLTGLVIEFSHRYAEIKKEKSLVDFNDLEHFCLQVLTEASKGEAIEAESFRPSPIAQTYKQRFAEILVDEYQDSNLTQEIIINMISRQDLQEPNVFMVGDVKQSIYRFRQARPELFLEKYSTYAPDEKSSSRKILLSRNFRSRQEVIDIVNFIFERLMSSRVGEIEYSEEEFLNSGAVYPELDSKELLAGGGIEFHLVETKQDPLAGPEDDYENMLEEEIPDNIQLEARLAAQRIQELLKPDEQGRKVAVFDKNQKKYRSIEYKDIVILLRTTKNWADVFAEEFTRQGIPIFVDTGTGFFKTAEVQVILSLLQIIDNPLQDIPLLAVLRSPLFSFSEEELAELRLLKRQGYFYEALQESTNPKAISFLEKLHKWREESLYLSTDRLLWQIYSETNFYGLVGALPGGEQRQANLRMLFERARRYEETSFKGLFHFINFIDKLKSSRGDMGSAQILGENENVVRLMSIHKSKGLEFPVVILAGCGKKFNLQDLNKNVLYHQSLGLGPDVVDYERRIAYPSQAKLAIREKLKIETLSEEMRILYVALTRAREKLIITGAVKDAAKSKQKWQKLCARIQDKKLLAFDVQSAQRYLDWLGPALLAHAEWEEFFRVWDRKAIVVESEEPEDNNWWEEALQDDHEQQGENVEIAKKAEADSKTECEIIGLKEEIRRRLNWEYPYTKIAYIPAKLSVTELKRQEDIDNATADFRETGMSVFNLSMKRPLFLEGKKAFTAAEKGTLMHFAMQHLDLAGNNFEEQLAEMVAKALLTKEQAENINLNMVREFLQSDLGRRMLASSQVRREVPFNLELPCREIYSDLENHYCQHEKIVLQGIIDCYFEEEDGLVLLDYKTDYVPPAGVDSLKQKYSKQIYYYTLALEKLTGIAVKEKYVYFFQARQGISY
jgi:ATP-dependent helicase/nuclease subunit A